MNTKTAVIILVILARSLSQNALSRLVGDGGHNPQFLFCAKILSVYLKLI